METKLFQPTFSGPCLVVLEQGQVRHYELEGKKRWAIGRTVTGNIPDIPLSSSIASRIHGEIALVDNEWFYFDLGSLNGTLYNGAKIKKGMNGRVSPVMLKSGDVLQIDRRNADKADPRGVWMLFSTESIPGEWSYYSLSGRDTTVIGRDASRCDLVQPLAYISAQHTKITCVNGKYYVMDCGSTAGTWLNGKAVNTPVHLKEKDRISLCDCHFIYTGNGLVYNKNNMTGTETRFQGNIILTADIQSKKVRNQNGHGEKELIRNVRLEVRSGELIALLGGSGAGKSTLMNCLNGTEQGGVQGVIQFQGEDLYRNYERLKYLVGNVPQKNILHETLSVEEELRNAAMLRLPGDASRDDIKQQVNKTLQALNLEARRRTQIKKLSGGEQKRVNIGIELVADRQLLCLDEPDAGLDPLAKKELFMTLQELAHLRGKCILTIIHDVSEIDLFDQIIMMAKVNDVGRLAYAGTPADARRHFQVDNLTKAYDAIQKEPERFIEVN